MNKLLLVSVVSVILLVDGISSYPANVIDSGSSLVESSRLEDSKLERVRVKQETGFDGKVRSIRFSLERDEKESSDGGSIRIDKAGQGDNAVPEVLTTSSRSDSKSSSSASDTTPSSSSRLRRAVDKEPTGNALDDLQAEENKVFRPLFVYRQEVNRRLKLKNAKKAGNRVQRTNTSISRHYYPYDYYQLYRRVPYNYYPRYRI